METIQKIALFITIIGALNWGLIGFFGFDLVAAIFAGSSTFGTISTFSRIIYAIVGLCGLYALSFLGRNIYSDSDD